MVQNKGKSARSKQGVNFTMGKVKRSTGERSRIASAAGHWGMNRVAYTIVYTYYYRIPSLWPWFPEVPPS